MNTERHCRHDEPECESYFLYPDWVAYAWKRDPVPLFPRAEIQRGQVHLEPRRRRYNHGKPGGVDRVAGPNGDTTIVKFLDENKSWNYPRKRTTIGGRLDNILFCREEYFRRLTFSFTGKVMIGSGIQNQHGCNPAKQTFHQDLFTDCLAYEEESHFTLPHTLIIEAEKPERSEPHPERCQN